jgi:hypothetical protein
MTDQIFACLSVAAWPANAPTMWRPSSGGDPGPKRSERWGTYRLRNCPEFDFKVALTRTIEPTGGPGIELATLADAARFVGHRTDEAVAPSATALGFCSRAAIEGRGDEGRERRRSRNGADGARVAVEGCL